MRGKSLLSLGKLPKLHLPPEWGVEPVPQNVRNLTSFDFFILWSSLGVGLLVLLAGSLLSTLPLIQLLFVVVGGSVLGSLLLASAGYLGSRFGIPTMVSLRAVLGVRGSYLPTSMNVLQLLGWTAFELMVMGRAAALITGDFAGQATSFLWIGIFAMWCGFLAVGGPLVVVRKWLRRVGIWLVYGSTLWITVQVALRGIELGGFPAREPEISIPLALDLVIAMPISWWPLISDYNRFARKEKGAFTGTVLGYTFSNSWFYLLGAAIVVFLGLGGAAIDDLILAILQVVLGAVILMAILVDETDNAFADIYSAVVSLQNPMPRVRQWKFILVVTALGLVMASYLVTLGESAVWQYEAFLLLIGGLFVPLLGVLFSDYFIVRRGAYEIEEFYAKARSFKVTAIFSWVLGVIIYFSIVFLSQAGLLPAIGSSLPAFGVSAGVHALLGRFDLRQKG